MTMTMIKLITCFACMINVAMAGRVVPRKATQKRHFSARGGGYTHREPSLRHRQLPHPMHHGHGGTSYLGCLNYTNTELKSEWKFNGRAPSCSYVSHGTNYDDDGGNSGGGGGGGGNGYDDAYSVYYGDDDAAAANGDDEANGDDNGSGEEGGEGYDDAYSADQDDYYNEAYDYDDQYYSNGNNDYYSNNGNGNAGRNSNNNNNDGYDNGDRADGGYQVDNEDIAEGNNGNNENPMLSFDITDCSTYNNLWVWDLAFSCESDKSLNNCECTFAEQLMDQEMLQCNDIEKCPKNCPVCETCFKLVGCAPMPTIISKTGVSASTLFAIFAAVGLFAFGVCYFYCRNRKMEEEDALEAHLIDKEFQDAVHKALGPPPPPEKEQEDNYDPETMLGPYPDVPDYKSDLSSIDSRATMESGQLVASPSNTKDTRVPDQISVAPTEQPKAEEAALAIVKAESKPIGGGESNASVEGETSATASYSSSPDIPSETVPIPSDMKDKVGVSVGAGDAAVAQAISEATPTPASNTAPSDIFRVFPPTKESLLATSSTAQGPAATTAPDIPRVFPPTKESLLATSSTAQNPAPVTTTSATNTAISPAANIVTSTSVASTAIASASNNNTSITTGSTTEAPTASASPALKLPPPVALNAPPVALNAATSTSASSAEAPTKETKDHTSATNSSTSDSVVGSSVADPPEEKTVLPPSSTSITDNAPTKLSTADLPKETKDLPPQATSHTDDNTHINSSEATLPKEAALAKESKSLPLATSNTGSTSTNSSRAVLPKEATYPNETKSLLESSPPPSSPTADAPTSPRLGMSVRNKGKQKDDSSTASAATESNVASTANESYSKAEGSKTESLSLSPVIKYDFVSPKASTETKNDESIAASHHSQDLFGDPSYASTYYEEAEATADSIISGGSDASRSERSPWIGDIDLSYTEPSLDGIDDNESANSRHSEGKKESKGEKATGESAEPTNVWLVPLKDLEELEEDESNHDSKPKPLTETEKAAAEADPSVVWLAPASSAAELAPEPKDDDASGSGSSWGPDDAGPWLAPI